jgi:hypothetical protein
MKSPQTDSPATTPGGGWKSGSIILVSALAGVVISIWGHPVQSLAGAVVVLAMLAALQGAPVPRSFGAALGKETLAVVMRLTPGRSPIDEPEALNLESSEHGS